MGRTSLTWIALGVLYLAFFSWYTSFGGPLSAAEVKHYTALMSAANPNPTPEREAIMDSLMDPFDRFR